LIYILSGPIGEGKSTALLKWIENRTDVFGILSPRVFKNERQFLDVRNNVYFKMEADESDEKVISIGAYRFLEAAFDRANVIISQAKENTTSGFIIIDEFGKLELKSEGLHYSGSDVIESTQDNANLHLIMVVRTSLLKEMLHKYSIENHILISKNQLSEILR